MESQQPVIQDLMLGFASLNLAYVAVTVDLPPHILSALRRSPEEFVHEMRVAAAIYWYIRGEISQSKAADIAGLHRVAFLDELARRGVDVFRIDLNDLRRELARG